MSLHNITITTTLQNAQKPGQLSTSTTSSKKLFHNITVIKQNGVNIHKKQN